MEAKKYIETALRSACAQVGISEPIIELEYPAEGAHGDLASNVALRYAKELGKNPRELAEWVVEQLRHIKGVEKIEIAGAGFINFHLAPETYSNVLKNIGISWGCNESQKGKRVMVEYTDPNPFKEFHIGHLMSNAIGESIARLIQCSGAEVKRANYQGDVGLHVAKAIYVYKDGNLRPKVDNEVARWGLSYQIGDGLYENSVEAKKEIDEINKKIYDGSDEQLNQFYERGRNVSLDEFERIYEILGMKALKQSGTERFFDRYFFESQTWKIGKNIVEENPEVFPVSDGARIFKGEEHGLHTRVFITSNNLPTYEAKDLGLLKHKADTWDFDESITITANEQTEYYRVVLAAAKATGGEIGSVAEKTKHVAHGMMRLSEGKMSSRKGNVITSVGLLQGLIEVAKKRAQESKAENKDELAKQIAVAAIKYQVLKQSAGKDIVFDKGRALSLEGDSGPYVQYAHARARTILDDAQKEGVEPHAEAPQTDMEREVARMLMQFPDVVVRAQEEMEPHYVTTYITNLASLYNSWYAKERVLGTDDAPRRLAITRAVADVLKNGLHLLGIKAPERM